MSDHDWALILPAMAWFGVKLWAGAVYAAIFGRTSYRAT